MNLRDFLRQLDQKRRASSFSVSGLVSRLIGQDPHLIKRRISHAETHRILVLRNNKRIGNMYFMIPFLRELREAYPSAEINLMIINRRQELVFRGLGLNNVLVSHFSLMTAIAFLKTINSCRKSTYDLMLMPHGSETDRLIGALLHAKNKVAFYNKKSNLIYPHSFRVTPESKHAALTALKLIEALGHRLTKSANHLMELSKDEVAKGGAAVKQFKGNANLCIAYFRGARGRKIISDENWKSIKLKFDLAYTGTICWIEILSPDISHPLSAEVTTFFSNDLRYLASVLRAVDLFICGDTGPLHLADAANARCIGLFTFTNPVQFGCLGNESVNVAGLDSLDAKKILAQLQINNSNQKLH